MIEQIALKADYDFSLAPFFSQVNWSQDVVHAKGIILDGETSTYMPVENVAELRFNYDVIEGKEFELIHYLEGPNFLQGIDNYALSHFGMHVTDINAHRQHLVKSGFTIVQEVITLEHTNPAVVNRHYHYAIFDHQHQNLRWKLIERLEPADKYVARAKLEEQYDHVIF